MHSTRVRPTQLPTQVYVWNWDLAIGLPMNPWLSNLILSNWCHSTCGSRVAIDRRSREENGG